MVIFIQNHTSYICLAIRLQSILCVCCSIHYSRYHLREERKDLKETR